MVMIHLKRLLDRTSKGLDRELVGDADKRAIFRKVAEFTGMS